MSLQQHYIDQETTNLLYENLVRTIDETNLVRKIISAGDQIRKIEAVSGPSIQSQLLRKEVSRMEGQLAEIRTQSAAKIIPHAAHY